jgi:hypothetical protein
LAADQGLAAHRVDLVEAPRRENLRLNSAAAPDVDREAAHRSGDRPKKTTTMTKKKTDSS